MDFRQLKTLNIPDGVVIRIATPEGVVLWERGVQPDYPNIPNNEIWYTSTNGYIVTPYRLPSNNKLLSNTYKDGKGVITFENDFIDFDCNYMFYNKTSLQTIQLPNSLKNIRDSAFENCIGLTSITIPNSVTYIASGAFSGCSSLTSITLPQSLQEINSSAFENCIGLTSITIPNSVTSIGASVFQGCSGISEITIPQSVTTIEGGAFPYNINIISESETFVIENDCLINNKYDEVIQGLVNKSNYIYHIPDRIRYISKGAFEDCSGISEITIPKFVRNIGYFAFKNCTALESITCLNSMSPTIGLETFYNNKENGTLYIPQGAEGYDSGYWKSQLLDKGWIIEYIKE